MIEEKETAEELDQETLDRVALWEASFNSLHRLGGVAGYALRGLCLYADGKGVVRCPAGALPEMLAMAETVVDEAIAGVISAGYVSHVEDLADGGKVFTLDVAKIFADPPATLETKKI